MYVPIKLLFFGEIVANLVVGLKVLILKTHGLILKSFGGSKLQLVAQETNFFISAINVLSDFAYLLFLDLASQLSHSLGSPKF